MRGSQRTKWSAWVIVQDVQATGQAEHGHVQATGQAGQGHVQATGQAGQGALPLRHDAMAVYCCVLLFVFGCEGYIRG